MPVVTPGTRVGPTPDEANDAALRVEGRRFQMALEKRTTAAAGLLRFVLNAYAPLLAAGGRQQVGRGTDIRAREKTIVSTRRRSAIARFVPSVGGGLNRVG
jgi:hypothetical protein